MECTSSPGGTVIVRENLVLVSRQLGSCLGFRVLERFNRAAEVSRWPVRLTWFGLTPVTGQGAAGPPPSPAETEATFRNLMKRFAESSRLDEVTQSGSPPTQISHT